MARTAIREALYSALTGNATLLRLLGTVSDSQRRIYSGWPQQQPVLSTTEPSGEGWLAFWEEPTTSEEDTVFEHVRVNIVLVVTRLSLADSVVDELDALWHWRVPQQTALQYGDRFVIRAKRMGLDDGFDEERKLYQRQVRYWLEMAQSPWSA